jgi:hypothetical protein
VTEGLVEEEYFEENMGLLTIVVITSIMWLVLRRVS